MNTSDNTTRPTTPPNKKPPISQNAFTPVSHHSTQDFEYLTGVTDLMRDAVEKDVDYIAIEVKRDEFFDHVLPPLEPGIDNEQIVKTLEAEGLIIAEKRSPSDAKFARIWRDFSKRPSSQKLNEEKVFAPLEAICSRVTELASAQLNRRPLTVTLGMRPNHAPQSHRASSTRPDAHFIRAEIEATLKQKEKETNTTLPRMWYDIALTAEFKKKATLKDRNDNASKLLYSIQQTMSLDACRRFTFGFTIENTDMRLWFCSRSILIVSEAFDFSTNVCLVTRVFLSFAFASEEELGWDPTICPIQKKKDGERAYIITVDNETYETVHVIADHGADALISRGARLWLAKNTRTGEPCILKDIWIEHDRQSERLIHATMLQDIEDKHGVEIRKEAELHFLTPVQDWMVHVDGIEDHTTNVILRGHEPPFQAVFHLKTEATKSNNPKKSVQPPAPSDPVLDATRLKKWSLSALLDARRKKLHHRKHYRVVFKEIGQCIHTLTSLANVFVVLRDSAKVLEWIHGAQWVHRDISVGNLYFYDGRGVIGDFEYAKKRDSDVSHEVRSCSIDFVSSEVMKHAFQYLPSDANWRPRSKIKAKKPEENANIVQFFHNDLHDLESLWWISIWELFFHRSNVDEELDEESAALADSEREKAIRKLFPRAMIHGDRSGFIDGKQNYEDAVGWMNDTFYELAGILNRFRVLLTTRYQDFEASFDWGKLQGMHKEIQQIFEQCRRYAFDIRIELLPYKSTDLWNLTSPSNDDDDTDNRSEDEHESSSNEDKTPEDLLRELNLNEDRGDDGDDEDEDNRPPFSVHMVK
ncbi:hypothetical protein ACEPAG_9438 [Sanghuangporus baumii]